MPVPHITAHSDIRGDLPDVKQFLIKKSALGWKEKENTNTKQIEDMQT